MIKSNVDIYEVENEAVKICDYIGIHEALNFLLEYIDKEDIKQALTRVNIFYKNEAITKFNNYVENHVNFYNEADTVDMFKDYNKIAFSGSDLFKKSYNKNLYKEASRFDFHRIIYGLDLI